MHTKAASYCRPPQPYKACHKKASTTVHVERHGFSQAETCAACEACDGCNLSQAPTAMQGSTTLHTEHHGFSHLNGSKSSSMRHNR